MSCFDEEEALTIVEFLVNKLNGHYCSACAANIAGNVYMNLLLSYCTIVAEQEGTTFEEVLEKQVVDLREGIDEFRKANAVETIIGTRTKKGAFH